MVSCCGVILLYVCTCVEENNIKIKEPVGVKTRRMSGRAGDQKQRAKDPELVIPKSPHSTVTDSSGQHATQETPARNEPAPTSEGTTMKITEKLKWLMYDSRFMS